MIAHVLLARPGAGAFERSFKAESEFDYAFALELGDTDPRHPDWEPHQIVLELAFGVTNSYAGELHCPACYSDLVAAYRAAGNRSLSVGDVVLVGEGLWFCASLGWDFIDQPSANLRAAIEAAFDRGRS